MNSSPIEIYTDGSCNPAANIGGWAAMLFINNERVILKGVHKNTTHNRMELLAVIEALRYLHENNLFDSPVVIFTDSQYVEKIRERKHKIKHQHYLTKKGLLMRNADLVEILINQTERYTISFIKVKAHQKAEDAPNYNREVDILVRKMVRSYL